MSIRSINYGTDTPRNASTEIVFGMFCMWTGLKCVMCAQFNFQLAWVNVN